MFESHTPSEQFSKIYEQYIEKIYRFVYLKVNVEEIAEDITSKVFLKGWESMKNGNQIHNPNAFLYQIARNMVIDHYREKGRTKTVSIEAVNQIKDDRTNVHEKAIFNSEMEVIKAAIFKIKKDYQDIIIWHYLEDMSAAQIAEILDKPVGTVRVMIHRGLKSLRDELNQQA